MKKLNILLLPILLLFVACEQDTPTSVSPSADEPTNITLAKNPNIDAFDMNDSFSGSGAKGNGFVKVIDGQMDLTIHARNLLTNHSYEVHVAIGADDDCSNFAPVDVKIFPVNSDSRGKFNFKELGVDLELDPGEYRIDYIVVRVDGIGGFILACDPASCVTIWSFHLRLYSKHIEKGQTQPSLEVEVITLDKPLSRRTRWLI